MDLAEAAPGLTIEEEEKETVTCTISCEGEKEESEECSLIAVFFLSSSSLQPYLVPTSPFSSKVQVSTFRSVKRTLHRASFNMSVDVFGRQLHSVRGPMRGPPREGFRLTPEGD